MPVVCGVSARHPSGRRPRPRRGAGELPGPRRLPPYVYTGDWRGAPGALRDRFQGHAPVLHALQQLRRLRGRRDPRADGGARGGGLDLHSVESATDVRRVTAIRRSSATGWRSSWAWTTPTWEGIAAGAVGWIAGLVNAFPLQSVELFDLASRGERKRRTSSTAGSCRSCGWTPCRGFSCNSSSSPSKRSVWAPPASAHPAWRWWEPSLMQRSRSSARASRSGSPYARRACNRRPARRLGCLRHAPVLAAAGASRRATATRPAGVNLGPRDLA